MKTNALALTGAVLLAALWSAPRVVAKPVDRPLVVAQAEKNDAKAQKQKKPQPQNAKKPQQQPRKPAAAQAKPKPQAQPKATQAKPKAAPARPKAAQAQQQPAAKPRAQAQEQERKPSAEKQNREERRSQRREDRQQQRDERRGDRRERNQDQQKPAAAQPKEQQKPSAAQQKQERQKPSAAEQKQEQQKPAARQQRQEEQKPAAAQQKEEQQRKPAAAQEKDQRKPAAAQQQKEQEQKPAAAQQKQEQQQPAAAQQKQEQEKPAAAQQKQEQQQAPAAVQRQQQQQQGARDTSEAAAQQAIKPRSADEFILRRGERRRGIEDVRRERRETREGDRIIIHEGDRRIVKEDNRIIIRHREAERFAIGARDVNVRRRGGEITTIVERPNGVRIINVTDDDGHLIRRVRRDSRGREIVIIDNRHRGRRPDIFIDVRPPRFHGHRDRYIVEAWRVPPPRIYEVFTAPPIEPLDQRYTLAQVRYNEALREYMPRVDLEINFESGSWQITPDQIAELSEIAAGLNRAIDQNPDEVYLIEGYTDAVGSEEDNLSLADRRAEAVAVALTQEFNVPPENLVTQGYGEEHLKVETEGPSRANRRVSIRRITPLIDKVAGK